MANGRCVRAPDDRGPPQVLSVGPDARASTPDESRKPKVTLKGVRNGEQNGGGASVNVFFKKKNKTQILVCVPAPLSPSTHPHGSSRGVSDAAEGRGSLQEQSYGDEESVSSFANSLSLHFSPSGDVRTLNGGERGQTG